MIIHLFNSSSISGPERLVLPALAERGAKFLVVNLREERIVRLRDTDPLEEYCRALGLPFDCVRVNGRWDRSAMAALRALLDRANPELVHAHDVKASIYLSVATRRGRRFPIVSTHHGIHGRPGWSTRLYERLYRRHFLRRFDRVLCVSTADHEFLLDAGLGGGRLRLHLNGADGRRVDARERSGASSAVRARWLPGEPRRDALFLFGAVGRLSAEKDHARLLKVLSVLNQKAVVKEWRCLMFGAGPLGEKLRRQAARLRLDRKVLWMGYRKEIGEELAGLDLLLSFSKAEGLPVSLIEAAWAGTPVMATAVGGTTDLIPDEGHGTLVDPEEPASQSAHRLRVLLSEEGRARLRDQAEQFQERVTGRFTRAAWLRRLEEIYSGLIPPRLAPSPSQAPERPVPQGDKIAVSN